MRPDTFGDGKSHPIIVPRRPDTFGDASQMPVKNPRRPDTFDALPNWLSEITRTNRPDALDMPQYASTSASVDPRRPDAFELPQYASTSSNLRRPDVFDLPQYGQSNSVSMPQRLQQILAGEASVSETIGTVGAIAQATFGALTGQGDAVQDNAAYEAQVAEEARQSAYNGGQPMPQNIHQAQHVQGGAEAAGGISNMPSNGLLMGLGALAIVGTLLMLTMGDK